MTAAVADGDLLGPAEIREIAARLGVRPAKRLGQNFVIDPGTVRRIVALAGLAPDDVVLEVGPGFGSLTLGLLAGRAPGDRGRGRPAAGRRAAAHRGRPAPGSGRTAGRGHRRRRSGRPSLPGEPPTALVANLPYNVAVPVVLHLLATLPLAAPRAGHGAGRGGRPDDRAAGQPGLRRALGQAGLVRGRPPGRAGAADRVLAGAERGLGAGRVHPPRPPPAAGVRREDVFAVVDAAFSQRRKTLRAALAALGRVGRRGRADPARGRGGPAARAASR